MVEGTYEDTKSRVSRGPGMSGEFKVNIDLGQGSVLSPLTGIYTRRNYAWRGFTFII